MKLFSLTASGTSNLLYIMIYKKPKSASLSGLIVEIWAFYDVGGHLGFCYLQAMLKVHSSTSQEIILGAIWWFYSIKIVYTSEHYRG